jgi:hypothetical protein
VALPAGSLLRVSVTSPGVAPMVTELPIPQRTK